MANARATKDAELRRGPNPHTTWHVNPLAWVRAEILHFAWQKGMYVPPDRRVLQRDILGALARDPAVESVLFVGVQWYTARYPESFAGKTFATIDPSPAVARHGGSPHAVGQVQDLAQHFPGQMFDAIVMSGVIGFGLDDPDQVDRALAACAGALRPGGLLVLGINERKPTHVDPRSRPAAEAFEDASFGSLGARIDVALPFREKRHTFVFWRKKKGA
ncbi:MAG: methyltransferase type 11 [Labilithrix sp.]|nr:methyltransferase type 11 [Labilithrix sp.]